MWDFVARVFHQYSMYDVFILSQLTNIVLLVKKENCPNNFLNIYLKKKKIKYFYK